MARWAALRARGAAVASAGLAATMLLALVAPSPVRSRPAVDQVDALQVVDAAPGPKLLTAAVRGTPESTGRLVRAVIEEPATGLTVSSAPVVLTPWWQTVAVTAPVSSPLVRFGVRGDPSDASWKQAGAFEVSDVALTAAASTPTASHQRQMLVEGRPYAMKGVVYHPSPVGGTPWTQFWNSNPAHCQSDAQLMRAAGINTARILYIETTYEQSSYRQCMDAFHAAGVGVIWSLQPPTAVNWQVDGPAYVEVYWQHVRTAVLRLKDHPATLAWEIGNEVNFRKPEGNGWFGQVDELARRTKQLDPHHLVTTALSSVEFFGGAGPVRPGLAPHVDMWGLNAYADGRGITDDRFAAMVAADPSRPLWISEFGVDRYRCVSPDAAGCDVVHSGEDDAAQAAWNGLHWSRIAAHLSAGDPRGAVVGGTVFMWADLWWPALGFQGLGTPATHDVTGTYNDWTKRSFPDGHHTGEWFGITGALPSGQPGPRVTSASYDHFLAVFTGQAGPAMHDARLARLGPCAAVFSWVTDQMTFPRVDVGQWRRVITGRRVTAEWFLPEAFVQGRYARTRHLIRVDGLSPGVAYQASLRVFDSEGRSTSRRASFRTPAGDC